MIGYAYLDNDNNISIRNVDYIEIEDPAFWDRNAHLISVVWKFNTEDESLMYSILSSLKRRELPNRTVIDFCKAIGFDLTEFLKKQSKTSAPKL